MLDPVIRVRSAFLVLSDLFWSFCGGSFDLLFSFCDGSDELVVCANDFSEIDGGLLF